MPAIPATPPTMPLPSRRPTNALSADAVTSTSAHLRRASMLPVEGVENVAPESNALFPVGTGYPSGHDLIGNAWRNGDAYVMRHEEYISFYHSAPDQTPLQLAVTPTRYLIVPIKEPTLQDEVRGKKKKPSPMGIIVLYQTASNPATNFQQRHRQEAQLYAERIALYLQNDRLQRSQQRSADYLHRLQEISGAFPASARLHELLERTYQFASSVADISSLLLTFYDRDSDRIYDIFAIREGQRVEGLPDKTSTAKPEERPVWWHVTQKDKQTLPLAPTQERTPKYDELLTGVWGDQHHTESFLLLPMKMFNRVIGSLCLTSMRPNAYPPEKVLVLETMVQIITVGIENARLYDQSHISLRDAKERAETLAAMNSALQSISTVLNASELLQKFVEISGRLVQAEICAFFHFSPEKEELIAQAMYSPTKFWNDGQDLPPIQSRNEVHNELINLIHLPYKGSLLEQKADESFFYLEPAEAEELAQHSNEGGAIFLRETGIQKMLMVPVVYQSDLVGMLAVHTPTKRRVFRPNEIGMLLAICAQTASAIRNAQLFEEIQEAYAQLQHLDKLKDEFLVTASHELRTPLSAISGYSSLLKRQSGRITPQQILRFASKIAGAAQQLSDLVASMTEAAHIGTVDKKLDLQLSEVKLTPVINLAVSMLGVNIEQKISAQVERNLWVRGDPLRVRQVISNLLDNAAKYSPPESTISLSCSASTLSQLLLPTEQFNPTLLVDGNPDSPIVLLRVYDQGEGIHADDQEKIFDKFFRLPRSLTTPVRGSGLGLYISRRYIEAMGGKLWLERSIPGEGSVFTFYLPRIEAPEESSQDKSIETEFETD